MKTNFKEAFQKNKHKVILTIIDFICIISLGLPWVYFVFVPIDLAIKNYTAIGRDDPTIVLSVTGFLILSIFFIFMFLMKIMERYLFKLYLKHFEKKDDKPIGDSK